MEIVLLAGGALLAAGAGVMAVLLLRGLRARRRVQAHVNACHARLGAAEKGLVDVEACAKAYPHDLPVPFAQPRALLDAALAQTHSSAAEVHARRRALLHGAGGTRGRIQAWTGPDRGLGRRPASAVVDLLSLVLDEPRRWRRLDAGAIDVEVVLAELEDGVEGAAAALARLEAVPAAVTAACAGLEATAGQAVALAGELAAGGACGPALDLAAKVACDLRDRLATASTATPRDTVAAHELFELLSLPVTEVHAQLRAWSDDSGRIEQALADARGALGDAGRRVGALPAGVDGSDLVQRLEALRNSLRAVEQEAGHPDVRALAGIAGRARDLVDAAGTLADDADGLAHKQIEFAAHYRRASATLARAELEMQAATAEPIYPLDWREWAGRCAALQRTFALIDDPAAPRALDVLELDGALAARLAAQATRLMDVVAQARTQREALRRLLQQPALAPDRPWEARAARLHDAANAYAAENWPAADRVPHLRDDAAGLADLHARWVPPEAWVPLPVDTLGNRLDAVARLSEALQALEPALARTEETLVALHAAETDAREGITACCRDLTRLVSAVHGARPSYDRSVTRHLGVLRQLVQHGEALDAAFIRRDRGTVAGKVKRAGRWARMVHGRIKPLCRDLDAAAGAARAALAAELKAVTEVLSLDSEPAARSATACAAAPRPKRKKERGEPLAGAASSIAYAAALAADRRATHEAIDALAAATRGLAEPLQAWRVARDEAEAAWGRLEAECRALAAGWPPLRCDSGRMGRLRDAARRAHDEAHREEERHLAGARRVSEATSRLHSLVDAYRRVARTAAEAEAAARQAHTRVQAAAGALDAARDRAHRPDVNAEIERLKRQWTRRPPSDDEAIAEMERLRRRLTSV